MTNKTMLDRVLMAYRPLYLQGLLLDGRSHLPATTQEAAPPRPVNRRRLTLLALTGLRHVLSIHRSPR
jgi:hypothetical protein